MDTLVERSISLVPDVGAPQRFYRTAIQHKHDLSELDSVAQNLPQTDDSQLFRHILGRVKNSSEIQADLLSIRRWHAYYAHQGNRDMNGLGHAVNTVLIAEQIGQVDLQAGILTPDEFCALILTAKIHDLGEINLGNATYGGKSEAHEAKEVLSFHRNIEVFFPDLTEQQRARLSELYMSVAMNKDLTQKLAASFNMVEVTGYVQFSLDAFREKSPLFQWEVLAWRILRYHLFRENKDIPVHLQKSAGAREYWKQRLNQLDQMVEHFKDMDQQSFLDTIYRRCCLPDYGKVAPFDPSKWAEIRELITTEWV